MGELGEYKPCECEHCVKDRETYDAGKHIKLLALMLVGAAFYLGLCLWMR
jgi:hypothetical protein